MQSKPAFILVLIGVILGFFGSVRSIASYFWFQQTLTEEFHAFTGLSLDGLLLFGLITSFIGLIMSLVLILYVIRFSKVPTNKDFITVIVLGGLGMILGMGLGGILVLIGGIVGLVSLDKK